MSGKVVFVFNPTGESVTSNSMKELWGKVKNDNELYAKIFSEASIDGESNKEFDARALQILHSREFEDEIDKVEPNIEEDEAVEKSAKNGCKVTVGNLPKKSSVEICENFLKQFSGVVMATPTVKSTKKEGIGGTGSYEVTFKDSSSAAEFNNLAELKFEKRVLSKKLVYSCNVCSRNFKFKHQLRTHIASLHIKRSFQCHACPKKILRQDNFVNHKLKHDEAVNGCLTCKKQFKTKLALVKHLVNGEYCPLQCILCRKTFVQKCNLEKHEKICNGHLDDIGGTCEICFKKFQ